MKAGRQEGYSREASLSTLQGSEQFRRSLLKHLFSGAPKIPPCLESCNANDDQSLDLSDAIPMLSRLFIGDDRLATEGEAVDLSAVRSAQHT